MAHRIVWFDIPVSDLGRAMGFYTRVLAARFDEKSAGSNVAVFIHGVDEVSGCLFKAEGHEPSGQGPLLYFNVDGRLQEAVDLVEAKGGQVLEGIHPIGPFGHRAIVLDSEGNRIALHSEPG